MIKMSKLRKKQAFQPLLGHHKHFQATVYAKCDPQQIKNILMMNVKHILELVRDGHVLLPQP